MGGGGLGRLSKDCLCCVYGGGGGIDDVGVGSTGLAIGSDEADICLLGNVGRP